jgi:hypothetical protein
MSSALASATLADLEAAGNPKDPVLNQVEFLWRRAFGRRPAEVEMTAALDHLQLQVQEFRSRPSEQQAEFPGQPDFLALVSLAHVLLNTNEFIYVD